MEFMSLPMDIVCLIFGCLIQKDLKSMRLVNRSLHRLVELHIPRVFLSPNKTNLDAFHGIIASDTFRPLVREIVWDITRLEFYNRINASDTEEGIRSPSWDLPASYRFTTDIQRNREQRLSSNQKRHLSNEDIFDVHDQYLDGLISSRIMDPEENFNLYNQLFDEQQAILASGQVIKALVLGLTSFPNLDRVNISTETWSGELDYCDCNTPFARSLPRGFEMPQPRPSFDVDELNASSIDVYEKLALPRHGTRNEWRGCNIVLAAILSTHPHHHITELLIDTQGTSVIRPGSFDADELNAGYEMTVQLFQTVPLTRLEVCLHGRLAECGSLMCIDLGSLRSALSNLTCLKHLALGATTREFDDIHYFYDDWAYIEIDQMLPLDIFATRLESLELRHLPLVEGSLFRVFQKLTSLSKISLHSVALLTDLNERELWHRVKDELVGAWKPDQPAIVFSSRGLNSGVSHELAAFLFGDGEYPWLGKEDDEGREESPEYPEF